MSKGKQRLLCHRGYRVASSVTASVRGVYLPSHHCLLTITSFTALVMTLLLITRLSYLTEGSRCFFHLLNLL